LAGWAESYGDPTEQDHAKLLASIKRGETKADIQSDGGELGKQHSCQPQSLRDRTREARAMV